MKRDRSSYLRTQDIVPLKEEVDQQVERLNEIRGNELFSEDRPSNRTDDVLDEVCQLLSLSFLCLGKTRESNFFFICLIILREGYLSSG